MFFKADNNTADSGVTKPLNVGLLEQNWYINDTHNIDYFNFYGKL